MLFETTKPEDRQKITEVNPGMVCAGAGVQFEVENGVVYVDDLRKIADYVGFDLLPLVESFFFGGWWWMKRGGAGE